MASSLAAQLAQLSANSKASLNVKAQKAAHSKSLIWEPRVAASQSYETLYVTCHQGFEELCLLDSRFNRFESTIFSEESQNQDRTQLTATENEELDRQVEAFLRLAGSRLRLMPAIKSIEWLIRRFRIHEENTEILITTFLPYHSIPAFATLLSIIPARIPHNYRFLQPYIKSLTSPSRSILVHQSIHHPEFLTMVSEYTLQSCRVQYQYPALISFWAGLVTEAISGLVDRARSGRAAIQAENDQALLHRLGPIFAESLVMKKVPSLQIASYMAIAVYVSKGNLEDVAVTAFMEQTVYGWTNDTVRPALVCLSIMAQHRSAKQMSSKVTKALMKVDQVGPLLVEIGTQRRVDKLANGLCLALIERLTKKGDARGLPTILAILSSQILKEKQIAVIFKSMILTALRLDDNNDEDGALRRELGSSLITLSQNSGKSGDIIQSVIQEVDFDIEELELKLDLSFRMRKLPGADKEDETATSNGASAPKPPQDLDAAIDDISSKKETLSTCLLPEPTEIFDEFSHLFLSIVTAQPKNSELLSKFSTCPQLHHGTALKDATYCSFFIRIWCGSYPALARAAALDMVKNTLKSAEGSKTDVQALIPYCVTALNDPSKRVRQAAADLFTVLGKFYSPPVSSTPAKDWPSGILYGKAKGVAALTPEVVARFLHLQILPSLEECVMDPTRISEILRTSIEQGKYQVPPTPALDKKDHMSSSARLALLTFLANHAVATPLLTVKDRLVNFLNGIKGVSGTNRTQLLLPALQWWAALSEEESSELASAEALDKEALDTRFVQIVVPNDAAGLDYLTSLLTAASLPDRQSLVAAIFGRLQKVWGSMSDETKYTIAQQMFEVSQSAPAAQDGATLIQTEAANFLKSVPLTTDILSFFLESIQTGTKMVTEPPPNKRRRTSSSDGNRGLIEVTPELSHALRRVTFVLQLVDSSDPLAHPDLLDGLFTALSELHHFRTVVGSELGYLQNLILRSLLAMMPAYKSDKTLKIDSSGGYGDLLVNCIQKSSSPVVQNSALLLIANLATTAPSLVLHSVMPIFTFMGASVLRQSDDYSAHVVSQTIQEVVPPLIESLRKGQKGPVAGASDILLSFTTAYEHIPSHRRQGLFVALVETLGPREFLFALIGMLVDRYGPSDALLNFIVDLMSRFDAATQLETLVKLLDLISNLFETKPGIAFVLLGISEEGSKDVEQIAQPQLSAFPTFLSGKKLKSQIEALDGRDDMEASEVRGLYAALLENILTLSHTVRENKNLQDRCGTALASLLYMLSINEFIKAVENLLDRPDMGLRHRVLRALEVRVDAEKGNNPASRAALLAFLPQLTAAIRESTDIRYKHTAVTCVDKIAEKYGKKDIEAVVAAALIIAGNDCLGQGEKRLRVMALLCLTSLVDVLGDAIVPVLPLAIPKTLTYLNGSLDGEVDEELHSAAYGFLTSLAINLPYMLSNSLARILEVSFRSSETELDSDTTDSRVGCLQSLAKRLDAKDVLVTLDKSWDIAMAAGFKAMAEYLDILGLAIDKHSKSTITKNARLLSAIFTKMFDMRRQLYEKSAGNARIMAQVLQMESSANEKALKMIYKLNDAAFRPMFVEFIEWMNSGVAGADGTGRILRQQSVFSFLELFFGSLKSIVTNYAGYIVEEAVKILGRLDPTVTEEKRLWALVLGTLAKCFEHDQDDFWQAPAHFGVISAALMQQYLHAPKVDVSADLVPATVELAAAADSQAHQKELNAALLKHLKSEQAAVRLAAIKCEQALTDRLGEEWLSMLHEMLPRISELQDDDDEVVETETHRWIVKIEGVLGESLDAMLQ